MSKKKKIIIIILSILLCAILSFTVYKIFFSKTKDGVYVSVKNGLSINFLDKPDNVKESLTLSKTLK